ncbi:MAG: DUF2905 domain-containing protein [Clostridia bacterium]|nr:DUF2905 domain-containing protein [Chloroflexota bacterium]MBC7337718.1 DUF2905 domain-containing protein [Clostridia bacterium]
MQDLGRLLLVMGGILVVLGIVLTLAGRIPWLGRLPGDIRIQRDNFTCIVPLATSLLLSLLLTVVLNVVLRILRR